MQWIVAVMVLAASVAWGEEYEKYIAPPERNPWPLGWVCSDPHMGETHCVQIFKPSDEPIKHLGTVSCKGDICWGDTHLMKDDCESQLDELKTTIRNVIRLLESK